MEKVNFKANRILSALIDGFFMVLISVAICLAPALIFFKELMEGDFIAIDLLWLILSLLGSFLVWILYLAIPTLFFKGATVGMRFNHLVFKSMKEKDYTFAHVLFREVGLVVTIVLSLGLALITDIFCICNNNDGRSFHDYFSSLKVVSDND